MAAPSILFADASRDLRTLVAMALEEAGYRVLTAVSGTEAVDLAAEHNPALVILDGQLPVLTGFDACTAIKAQSSGPPPKVLILSSLYKKSAQSEEAALLYGADDCLRKPFEMEELLDRVANLLRPESE